TQLSAAMSASEVNSTAMSMSPERRAPLVSGPLESRGLNVKATPLAASAVEAVLAPASVPSVVDEALSSSSPHADATSPRASRAAAAARYLVMSTSPRRHKEQEPGGT